MIWSSLLKGKEWDEIQVILTTADFTVKNGKIDKIKDFTKDNKEKEKEETESENSDTKVKSEKRNRKSK